MRKLTTLLIAMLVLSGLSGCVDNKTDNKGNNETTQNSANIQTGVNSDIEKNADIGTEVDRISVNTTDTETVETSDVGSGWCISGNKITVNNEEFTIVGITTYEKEGKTYTGVCKAEKVTENGSSIIYYNEDYVKDDGKNKFFRMDSKGKNAKASAIVTVGKR